MTLWTNITAEQATGGESNKTWQAARVEIDSRRVQPGDLFVAIKGERFDGHAFVDDALSKGAVAAVVSQKTSNNNDSLLVVPDTMKALEDFAHYARSCAKGRIIGVTGSVGKTSAKEMLKLALSAHGKTYATTGNYNNHIGTPLNLANLPPDYPFAVFEMGMNHAGEISHLTRMVRPHVAVITNVEAVHLEFFDSIDAIADAKAEIFEGAPDGIAVLNADSRHLNRLKMAAIRNKISKVITFGDAIDADVRLIAYQPTTDGCNMDISLHENLMLCHLGAVGSHWAKTALMTLATTHAIGLDDMKTVAALGAFVEPQGRGGLVAIPVAGGKATLIDDSYNASPASMKSAFSKTSEVWEAGGRKGRKIAALGEMLELGKDAASFHAGLAGDLQRHAFDIVFTSGALMKNLRDALPESMQGAHESEAMLLAPHLSKTLKAGDYLLLKGSHGSKIYQLADALQAGEKKHAV